MAHSKITRRSFMGRIGAGAAACAAMNSISYAQNARPNFLFIMFEDICPLWGCYGDSAATTLFVDGFAQESVLFNNVYSVSGVCAPSRSCIISGVYPTTLGTHNQRSNCTRNDPGCVQVPDDLITWAEAFRDAGYHTSNASTYLSEGKEDFNFRAPYVWNNNRDQYAWRERQAGQPFFHVMTWLDCHEGKVRGEPVSPRITDTSKIEVPPYYPDTPKVRQCMGWYYDNIALTDSLTRDYIGELEKDGLLEDTIIFIVGDNGTGIPRGKRWVYDSGLHVPLLVHIPEKFRVDGQGVPGTKNNELISFLDFAPTFLNLAGIQIPPIMQGRAFLGPDLPAQRSYIHAARDRMDERYDCIRAVRNNRYKYIRNFEWWKPYQQVIQYLERNPIMQELRYQDRKDMLTGIPAQFMAKWKPKEELYDCENDPWETTNLASSPDHRQILSELRQELKDWMISTRDLGLMPEGEQDMLSKQQLGDRYAIARQGSDNPVEKWLDAIELSEGGVDKLDEMIAACADPDPVVRFWAARGIGHLGAQAVSAESTLNGMLTDSNPSVIIAASVALMLMDKPDNALTALRAILSHENQYIRLLAVNEIENLGYRAKPLVPDLEAIHTSDPNEDVWKVIGSALSTIPNAEPVQTAAGPRRSGGKHPNIAANRGIVTLETVNHGPVSAELYNSRGAKIASCKTSYPGIHSVNTTSIPAGRYVLRVKAGSNVSAQVVVVR
ncbi:MAG: sulfatase-like hydrolase/transferase [Chitinivibrionales bacterium]|nr:sulfatase-like hydrolase/transferase [Chitinivibrionales bacterium]